jgi:orotate phosphoribosyltransferase
VSERDELLALLREHSYREGTFTLASGATSSTYVDVRRTALTARGAQLIGQLACAAIIDAEWQTDAVGGMTLGADPLTTAIQLAGLSSGKSWSGVLVRKAPKAHGAESQIERGGDLPDGGRVVALDDTVTTGGSSLKAIEAMRACGYIVQHALCVVDRLEGGVETLAAAGVTLQALFTVEDLRLRP